jgi:hypothetical protein
MSFVSGLREVSTLMTYAIYAPSGQQTSKDLRRDFRLHSQSPMQIRTANPPGCAGVQGSAAAPLGWERPLKGREAGTTADVYKRKSFPQRAPRGMVDSWSWNRAPAPLSLPRIRTLESVIRPEPLGKLRLRWVGLVARIPSCTATALVSRHDSAGWQAVQGTWAPQRVDGKPLPTAEKEGKGRAKTIPHCHSTSALCSPENVRMASLTVEEHPTGGRPKVRIGF